MSIAYLVSPHYVYCLSRITSLCLLLISYHLTNRPSLFYPQSDLTASSSNLSTGSEGTGDEASKPKLRGKKERENEFVEY